MELKISDEDMSIARDIVDGKYEGDVVRGGVVPLPKSIRLNGDVIAMIDALREIWGERGGEEMSRVDVMRACIKMCACQEGLL